MTEFLVLSPHLDDAVLSCGRLLARCRGAVVATLFAGSPSPALSTNWDCKSGYTDSDNAMTARRREDRAALESLGAVPFHCEILDGQYGPGADRQDRLAATIQNLVAKFEPAVLVTPL